MTNTELQNNIDTIIETCVDGMKGYRHAADSAENPEFKTIFNRLAQQRKGFVEDIKTECRTLGMDYNEEGTIKGYFHRNWLSTKAFFASSTDESVIESAVKGEEEAIEHYEKSINPSTPKVLKDKLDSQLHMIKGTINQLQGLKHEVVS